MFTRAVFYISSRSLVVVPKVAATATAAAALWLASRPEACANTASSDELSLNKSLAHDAIEVIGKNMLHATADTTKEDKLNNFMLFGGTSSTVLAEEIAYELKRPLGRMDVSRYADGEIGVSVLDNVRGKDVYIVQSTCQPVNETVIELCLMISSMRRSSAKTITAIIPYYGYKRDVGTVSSLSHQVEQGTNSGLKKRQAMEDASSISSFLAALKGEKIDSSNDSEFLSSINDVGNESEETFDRNVVDDGFVSGAAKKNRGPNPNAIPISAADIARMLETVGVDRVISVELQPPGQGQIEGFFSSNIPVESLRSAPIAIEHLSRLKLKDPVIVAPNESCIKLAHDLRNGLEVKTGKYVGLGVIIEAGASRGSDRYAHGPSFPPIISESKDRMELVGDVNGHDVVICDDMIDTARSLVARLQLIKDRGAGRVVAFATHGLFNGGALQRIRKSALSDVVVTNTVPLRDDIGTRDTHKIAQLSVAPLLAEAIWRIQSGKSVQDLRIFDRSEVESRYRGQDD
jgi:ribose-phosphate pyrophosphokinase